MLRSDIERPKLLLMMQSLRDVLKKQPKYQKVKIQWKNLLSNKP